MRVMVAAARVVGNRAHLGSSIPALPCLFSSSELLSEQVVLPPPSSHFLMRKRRFSRGRQLVSQRACPLHGSLDSNPVTSLP